LIFVTSLFCSLHGLCICVFKMGGNVRATAMFREASTFTFLFSHHVFTSLRAALSFVASRYLCLHRDAIFCYFTIFLNAPRCHLLLRHDIYECTAMPSFVAPRYLWLHRDAFFCCITIFMNAPRCHLLLCHNIYDCTAMPIFWDATIFYFPAENPFPNLHRHFIICNKLLSISKCNTVVQRRDISSTVFKIYASVVPSAATRR